MTGEFDVDNWVVRPSLTEYEAGIIWRRALDRIGKAMSPDITCRTCNIARARN